MASSSGSIALARRETVVIHDSRTPSLAPYLPAWFQGDLHTPAAFLLVGLGLGLQYPVLLPLFVSGYPDAPDRAAARATLASGLAIGGAPLVLAWVSDRLGLHDAYLIVPLLLVVLAVRVGLRREVGPRVDLATVELPGPA